MSIDDFDVSERHHPTICRTSRRGCWWSCSCGAEDTDLYANVASAGYGWARHLAEATKGTP